MNASRTEKTKDTYLTPKWILENARRMRGPFALDPATNPHNPTDARIICCPGEGEPGPFFYYDGLAQNWTELAEGGMIWLNPPFGGFKHEFLEKCNLEYSRGAEIQAIVPADPATVWWQRHCSPRLSGARACCWLRKRPTFLDPVTGQPPLDKNGKPTSAMFGCCIVYWGADVSLFEDVWKEHGDVDYGYMDPFFRR